MSATAQRLASIIKETVKCPADLVDRYGGVEFVVVLHHTDQKRPPSIKANRQLQLRITKELCRFFPIGLSV